MLVAAVAASFALTGCGTSGASSEGSSPQGVVGSTGYVPASGTDATGVLFPTYTNKGNAIVPAAIAGLAVALYTLFHPGIRRNGQVREVPPSTPPPAPANGRRGDLRPPARLP